MEGNRGATPRSSKVSSSGVKYGEGSGDGLGGSCVKVPGTLTPLGICFH